MTGGAPWRRSNSRASSTTPTISRFWKSGMKPKRIRLPMASPLTKKACREAPANYDEARMLGIGYFKAATSDQTDAKSFEETWRHGDSIGHHPRARVRIFRRGRSILAPAFRAGDGDVRKSNRQHPWYVGDPLDELLVVIIRVQILIDARCGIENDFEQIVFLETKIEGAQFLEGAHQEARTQQ